MAQKSKLGAKLAEGKFVSFVEILPPRGVDAKLEIEGARRCAEAGIDCINVPDGPRASARMSAQVTCQLIQAQAESRRSTIFAAATEIFWHPIGTAGSPRGRRAQPHLHYRRPAAHGLYPDATAVFDVDAIGLVNIVNNLNHGLDIAAIPWARRRPC